MEQQFTQLGTGQAFTTVLNEKGIPTETVVTHLLPPKSYMGPLSEQEYSSLLNNSDFYKKYKDVVDPQSAFEMLSERMQQAEEEKEEKQEEKKASSSRTTSRKQEKSTLEEVMGSPLAKQVGRELVRGVFGMLFGSTPRRSTRKRSSIF